MQEWLRRVPKLLDPKASAPLWGAASAIAAILVVTFVLVDAPRAPRKAPARPIAHAQSEPAPTHKAVAKREGPRHKAERAAAPVKQPISAPPSVKGFLRIASWNLEGVPVSADRRLTSKAHAPWRTSFGSERSTVQNIGHGTDRYEPDADVILLQGISDATLLRRAYFPARRWHLIVPASTASGLTGIALRVRRGLRITAREYFPSIQGVVQDEGGGNSLLGTAVRVLDRGHTFWLASFSLPPECAEAPANCPARARLSEWEASKRRPGEGVVIGGSLAPPAIHSGSEVLLCGRQVFRTDLEKTDPWTLTGDRLAGSGSGCALTMDLQTGETK